MLAWLTPDLSEFSNPQKERSITLPGDLFYLVTGAISQLAEAQNWEQFGDATPEETADFFLGVLEEYLMSDFRNLGMIAAFASTVIPPRWLLMNGQTVAQSDYPELAGIAPSSWISGTNLVLPDTRGRMLRNTPSGGSVAAIGGSENHTLAESEMPAHVHQYLTRSSTVLVASGSGFSVWAGNNPGADTEERGGGQPHNNMPPYYQVTFAVYAGR